MLKANEIDWEAKREWAKGIKKWRTDRKISQTRAAIIAHTHQNRLCEYEAEKSASTLWGRRGMVAFYEDWERENDCPGHADPECDGCVKYALMVEASKKGT